MTGSKLIAFLKSNEKKVSVQALLELITPFPEIQEEYVLRSESDELIEVERIKLEHRGCKIDWELFRKPRYDYPSQITSLFLVNHIQKEIYVAGWELHKTSLPETGYKSKINEVNVEFHGYRVLPFMHLAYRGSKLLWSVQKEMVKKHKDEIVSLGKEIFLSESYNSHSELDRLIRNVFLMDIEPERYRSVPFIYGAHPYSWIRLSEGTPEQCLRYLDIMYHEDEMRASFIEEFETEFKSQKSWLKEYYEYHYLLTECNEKEEFFKTDFDFLRSKEFHTIFETYQNKRIVATLLNGETGTLDAAHFFKGNSEFERDYRVDISEIDALHHSGKMLYSSTAFKFKHEALTKPRIKPDHDSSIIESLIEIPLTLIEGAKSKLKKAGICEGQMALRL